MMHSMAFSITALRQRLRAASRAERELWFAAFTVGFGLIVLPFLIYLAGKTTLGAYETGGLGTYLLDFFKGLVRPHLAYWLVVLGPYLLIMLTRGFWLARRSLRSYLEHRSAAQLSSGNPGQRS
jgi:hypothetical protein